MARSPIALQAIIKESYGSFQLKYGTHDCHGRAIEMQEIHPIISVLWSVACVIMSVLCCVASPPISGPVRIAVIPPQQADARFNTCLPLIEDQLAKERGIELVDRANLGRIRAEQRVILTDSTLSGRIRLGSLLSADLLLLVTRGLVENIDGVELKIVDVRTGLQLERTCLRMVGATPEYNCEQALACVKRAVTRRELPISRVVAVFPFMSNDLGDRNDADARRYQVLTEEFVSSIPGYLVVDMAEAQEIIDEKFVASQVASMVQHPYPVFIHGSYRNTGIGADRKVSMALNFESKGIKPFDTTLSLSAPLVPRALRDALREGLATWTPITKPDANPDNTLAEAAHFWREAQRFQTLGQHSEALTCLQTVLLLLPEDAEAVSNRFEDIVIPLSPVAPHTRLCDAAKAELLSAYAVLSAWEYVDEGHVLIEELQHSTLPLSGTQSSQEFWNGLRIPCDSILLNDLHRIHYQSVTVTPVRIEAARRLASMRTVLIRVYEQPPLADPDAMKRWHTFVDGTFPYLFQASSYTFTTRDEVNGYLTDLTRAAIAFSDAPDTATNLVDAMNLYAGISSTNMPLIRRYLDQAESGLRVPERRLLCQYARMNWCARKALQWLDQNIVSDCYDEIRALHDTLCGDTNVVRKRSRLETMIIEKLFSIPQQGVEYRLRIWLEDRGRLARPPPRSAGASPIQATIPHVQTNEPPGFYRVPVQLSRDAKIETWAAFDGELDLLTVRIDHNAWRIMKLAPDHALEPFFAQAANEPHGRPVAITSGSNTIFIAYPNQLVLCDMQGRIRATLTCGEEFPEGRLGAGICLKTGVVLWSGSLQTRRGGQTWIVRVSETNGTYRSQVVFEGRKQAGDADTDADIAFEPVYVVGIGVAGNQRVLFGRSNSRKPLLLESAGDTVSVFPFKLGAFVQDRDQPNHLYWIEDNALTAFDAASLTITTNVLFTGMAAASPWCGWRHDARRVIASYGGNVFFMLPTGNYLEVNLGYVDTKAGRYRIFVERYAQPPLVGDSHSHGLLLCGKDSVSPGRFAFWHTLALDKAEIMASSSDVQGKTK